MLHKGMHVHEQSIQEMLEKSKATTKTQQKGKATHIHVHVRDITLSSVHVCLCVCARFMQKMANSTMYVWATEGVLDLYNQAVSEKNPHILNLCCLLSM